MFPMLRKQCVYTHCRFRTSLWQCGEVQLSQKAGLEASGLAHPTLPSSNHPSAGPRAGHNPTCPEGRLCCPSPVHAPVLTRVPVDIYRRVEQLRDTHFFQSARSDLPPLPRADSRSHRLCGHIAEGSAVWSPRGRRRGFSSIYSTFLSLTLLGPCYPPYVLVGSTVKPRVWGVPEQGGFLGAAGGPREQGSERSEPGTHRMVFCRSSGSVVCLGPPLQTAWGSRAVCGDALRHS